MQDQSSTLQALEKLVSKKEITLGRMSRDDMHITLALACLCVPVAVELSEAAVSQALKRWLETDGAMLRIDHVELRRTLIDLGFWERDNYGRLYRRPAPEEGRTGYQYIVALQSIDIAQFVRDARARHDELRARRIAAHAGAAPRD
ncbi:DUF2087 domain-containing protein [Chromobacterium subtsugae]|uniref:DUF2087 domain-containing protein n=1 Tax=Chromobacterium subtsugae TaxID=251747 RepID=UPI000640F83C|nr:DUF2087 domain-containing protein [Chromobacterium subtsugae]